MAIFKWSNWIEAYIAVVNHCEMEEWLYQEVYTDNLLLN